MNFKKVCIIVSVLLSATFVNAQDNVILASNTESTSNPEVTLPEMVLAAISKCKASSTLGGECSVSCPEGQTASCRSGFFVARCNCLTSSLISVELTGGTEVVHIFTAAQISLTTDLISFLKSMGSIQATVLAGDLRVIMSAGIANNLPLYYAAGEKAALDASVMSAVEKSKVNQWLSARGISDSL